MTNYFKITQILKDFILGTMLGDGSFETQTRGKTWRYRVNHSLKEEAYVLHQYEILKSLRTDTPPRHYTDKKGYHTVSFDTRTSPSLRFYAKMFYKFDDTTKRWVKRVPLKLEKFLTPRAIAYRKRLYK